MRILKISKHIISFLFFYSLCPFSIFAQDNDSDSKRKFDYYFYEAINKKAQGKHDQALDLFQHCFALDSTNASVLMELGNYYNVLQNNRMAMNYWEKAVAYDPDNFYYSMSLASLYKTQVKKQQLVNLYEKMHKRYPNKMDLTMLLAEAYADNGEFGKSIEVMNEVEKVVGLNESISLNKFQLYSMLNQKGKAFDEIKALYKKDVSNPRYMMLLGDLYLQDNQTKEALKYYEMVKKSQPDYPGLVVSMANYYEQLGEKEKAQEQLLLAIQDKDMDVELKMQLLTRYLQILQSSKQKLESANGLFVKLIEQHPAFTQLNLMYGNLLLLESNKKEAMEQFQIYIDANPNEPAGYEQMLQAALPDNLDKVIEITEKAMKYMPQYPVFYFYNGGAKYQQNRHKEALDIFQKGLKNAKFDNPAIESDFHGQIGDLYHTFGNDSLAFDSYEKALKLNPQNLLVLNNYSYYLSLKRKDLAKAEQMSSLTIKAEPTNATYLDTYGWILFLQGAYTTSKIYLEKAVQYGEQEASAEVHEHFGDVLAKLGETDKAVEQWLKAKELKSTSETLDEKIKTKKFIESK